MPKKLAVVPRAVSEPEAIPQSFGSFFKPLERPEEVGSTTAGEALEIRARNELIRYLELELQTATRILSIARNEKVSYLERLLTQYGLGNGNQYVIDDSSGIISQVATRITPDQSEPIGLSEESSSE